MSGVPPVARISLEEIKGAPKWAETIVRANNALVDYLTQTLGKGVTLGQNLAGNVVGPIEVRTASTYSSGEAMAVRFNARLGAQRAVGCLVLKVTDLAYPNATLSGNYTCSTWEQQSEEILVRWISGLEASHRYAISFWVPV